MVSEAEVWQTNTVSRPSRAEMSRSQARKSPVMSMKPLPRVRTRSLWLAWLTPAMIRRAPRKRDRSLGSKRLSRLLLLQVAHQVLQAADHLVDEMVHLVEGKPGKLRRRVGRQRSSLSLSLFRLGELVLELPVLAVKPIDLRFERQGIVGDALAGPMVELLAADRHRARRSIEAPDAVANCGHGVAAWVLSGVAGRRGEEDESKGEQSHGRVHGLPPPLERRWSSPLASLASPTILAANVPQRRAA